MSGSNIPSRYSSATTTNQFASNSGTLPAYSSTPSFQQSLDLSHTEERAGQEAFYTPPTGSERLHDGQTDYLAGRPSVGSPPKSDYGMIGGVRLANSEEEEHGGYYQQPQQTQPGQGQGQGGYGSGRFSTHLE